MKNYRNSDYAANKFAEGIVYRFADEVVEVTLEDYLRESPGKSASDFTALKAISDDLHLNSDRADYRQTWKNVPISGFEKGDVFCVPSAEAVVIDVPHQEANEEQQRRLMKSALATLTKTQRRRYIQYHVMGKTLREIAAIEGIAFQVVNRSILSAQKKIKKYLKNIRKKG